MHSLKNFTVSGNFYQVLQDIEEVSDDLEFFMSSIGSPSVLVSKLALSN
jgi:PmbA protein